MVDLAPIGPADGDPDDPEPTAAARVLLDAFGRISSSVEQVLDGLDEAHLAERPDPAVNSIAWLVWHLTRIEDDHVAAAFGHHQVWTSDGWCERFGLPFPADATGYGHSPEEVAAVTVGASLLRDYHRAVHERTGRALRPMPDHELERVVDERWDPPVTLAVRLVSVVADGLEHAGQAAYLRGLLERGDRAD